MSGAYEPTNTRIAPFNVPTNLVLVGASNVPSVVLANAEVVADCRTVSEADDTTAQLPAPRRVRCAIKFATRLIRTARAACSSPTYVAVPDTVAWLYVNSVEARVRNDNKIS